MGGHGVWSGLEWLWYVVTGLLCVPCAVVCTQSGMARRSLVTRRPQPLPTIPRATHPRVAIVIPAHDEEFTLGETLSHLRGEIAGGMQVVVVADHCKDRTSAIAHERGAIVVERHDEPLRGKGHALASGIAFLRATPPDVVVFLDADCHFEDGALTVLARAAAERQQPMQAVYWLDVPPHPSARAHVSAFAFRFKNEVRARGLMALGLPVHLTGSGMAFPWHIAARAPFASSSIVEDLELGIQLALAGTPAHLCSEAVVRGQLPDEDAVATLQRRRWEHGYLQTLFRYAPRLLAQGIGRRQAGLIALGLDLAVPPLMTLQLLLVVNLIGTAFASAIGWLSGLAPMLAMLSEATLLWAIWRGWRCLYPEPNAPTSLRALVSY